MLVERCDLPILKTIIIKIMRKSLSAVLVRWTTYNKFCYCRETARRALSIKNQALSSGKPVHKSWSIYLCHFHIKILFKKDLLQTRGHNLKLQKRECRLSVSKCSWFSYCELLEFYAWRNSHCSNCQYPQGTFWQEICIPAILHCYRLRHCMRDRSTGLMAYMDRKMIMMMVNDL